jgi:hypothetical protein
MTRAAHEEIRRLSRLMQGAELQLMLLSEHRHITAADEEKVRELEQRQRQLLDRIAWFEDILREHDTAAE